MEDTQQARMIAQCESALAIIPAWNGGPIDHRDPLRREVLDIVDYTRLPSEIVVQRPSRTDDCARTREAQPDVSDEWIVRPAADILKCSGPFQPVAEVQEFFSNLRRMLVVHPAGHKPRQGFLVDLVEQLGMLYATPEGRDVRLLGQRAKGGDQEWRCQRS